MRRKPRGTEGGGSIVARLSSVAKLIFWPLRNVNLLYGAISFPSLLFVDRMCRGILRGLSAAFL